MKGPHAWSIVYVISVLVANYTAGIFIPFPVFGLLSVGTIVFGLTFTARDYVHTLGRRYVYSMILVAGVLSLAMSLALGVPTRIVVASFLTICIAEAADTEVYQRFINKNWLTRVSLSNSVSVPLDSILFTTMAFAGVMSAYDMAQIIFADVVVKFAVGFGVALLRSLGVRKSATSH
ncbi:MAG: VUT family protein [Anaerolineales bacterium]|nr:VUT family protein [Anaerolineales bacterium]